jgi:predicted transcriptional regulator
MKRELLENKYQALLIMFDMSYIKDDTRIYYMNKQFVANEMKINYSQTRYLYKLLINEELIERVNGQLGVGYLITDKGMNIINEIKGDINTSESI